MTTFAESTRTILFFRLTHARPETERNWHTGYVRRRAAIVAKLKSSRLTPDRRGNQGAARGLRTERTKRTGPGQLTKIYQPNGGRGQSLNNRKNLSKLSFSSLGEELAGRVQEYGRLTPDSYGMKIVTEKPEKRASFTQAKNARAYLILIIVVLNIMCQHGNDRNWP